MVLGFNRQFVGPIMNGTKKHTIREDKTNRWKAGNVIHMAVGVRTKNYTQISLQQCISVQTIKIEHIHGDALRFTRLKIDGTCVGKEVMLQLAINDGFNGIDDFFEWFDKDFTGKIIHWTDLKY